MKKTLYDYMDIIKGLPLKDKYAREDLFLKSIKKQMTEFIKSKFTY